jgi:asparagine synthase (glutamine-hydrolysing)
MCGLLGVAGTNAMSHQEWLKKGSDLIKHRGPDGAGEWWAKSGHVGLAHRRLSVIDLSAKAHQPMLDDTGQFVVVFNGEIYNYQELRKELTQLGVVFRTSSDTEVLMESYKKWGPNCLNKLNGMFVFVIYDLSQQTLFMARDRAGEKPLYYYHDGKTISFASELKALIANPALTCRIDADSMDCYLALGYVPGGRCILKGYNKLPPAHALYFYPVSGDIKIWRYWDLPSPNTFSQIGDVDDKSLLNELEKRLADAVRHQLVADVPVGVLLSGGVDSSLITALAVRESTRVKTFTVRFPGYARLDETEHARLISKHFDTEHIELEAQTVSVDILHNLAKQYDEPIIDSSMIPTSLLSQLVRRHCKVALGGDGGDELFGGYNHYNRMLWLQQRLRFLPPAVRRMIASTAEQLLPIGWKGRNWMQALGLNLQREVPLMIRHFDLVTRRNLVSGPQNRSLVAEAVYQEFVSSYSDLLQRATRADFMTYLTEDILVKVDRASMLHSLEIRAPFLDYRLIEFAFATIPSHLKATTQERKILLKRLSKRLLPPNFDSQRKQGFSIPLNSWLQKGAFRELFHEVLLHPKSLFSRSKIQHLLRWQDRGSNNAERLFGLVMIELWRREYGISF